MKLTLSSTTVSTIEPAPNHNQPSMPNTSTYYNQRQISPITPPSNRLRPSYFLALLLFTGTLGLSLLSAWARFLGLKDGRFVLAEDNWLLATPPRWLVLSAVAAALTGFLGLITAFKKDRRFHDGLLWCLDWAEEHRLAAAIFALSFLLGAVDIYEIFYDAFNKKSGFFIYQFRDDLQIWMFLGTALLAALTISSLWRSPASGVSLASRLGTSLSRKRGQWRWWAFAGVTPLVLAAAMSKLSLDGIPHFSDALTYLMQGRILYTSGLYLPKPPFPELWIHTLFFITDKQHIDPATGQMVYEGSRFFGKYPIGWPAIIGLFDRVNLLFLASASLVALISIFTGLLARQFAPRRIAVLAALLMGLSPWLWFSGADFASHPASACAVTAFYFLFLYTVRKIAAPEITRAVYFCALGAGLALGAAVLIRPGDALNFALPAVITTLVLIARKPGRWLTAGALIAAGALSGVLIYLYCNYSTTGHPFLSPYKLEKRWSEDWNPTFGSMLARFAFQWAELNARFPGWGIGGVTVATLGAMAAIKRYRSANSSQTPAAKKATARMTGLWIFATATTLFFLFNTAFGFTNVWWGPRWLLPATPLLAIFTAYLVDEILQQAASQNPTTHPGKIAAAQFALIFIIAGFIITAAARYSGQFYVNTIMPPHSVSAAAQYRAEQMGINNAVIALPVTAKRPPLDARSGMAYLYPPFDNQPIIYVRAMHNWQQMAQQTYSNRRLYELIPDPAAPQGFKIIEAPSQ